VEVLADLRAHHRHGPVPRARLREAPSLTTRACSVRHGSCSRTARRIGSSWARTCCWRARPGHAVGPEPRESHVEH
jgi:hypothetical protein